MGDEKQPEYPWQIPLPAWAPGDLAEPSEAERRRDECEHFFEFELHPIEEGVESRLVYDEEADVFRFPDGRFALSKEHADWAGLKAVGYFRYWGAVGEPAAMVEVRRQVRINEEDTRRRQQVTEYRRPPRCPSS